MKPPRINKGLAVPVRREREGMSKEHLRDLHKLPCCVTGQSNVVVHHLLRTGERGMSLKSPDKWGIPLSAAVHNALHHNGDEDAFLAAAGVDGRGLATALWEARGDVDAMRRVVDRCLQNIALKSRPRNTP